MERTQYQIFSIINDFASEALRTLCLAFIPNSGYTLIALVGDNIHTTEVIAKECSIL